VRLDRSTVPPLTVIAVESAAVDPQRLADRAYLSAAPAAPETGSHLNALALEWTAGVPQGWAQVEAIVRRLRTEYRHVRTAAPAADGPDPVGHFLRVSRAGPDYQFATAAALLLRELGYRTRLVSGFYAAPERYDRRLRHTAVLAEDVHFWLEVRLLGGEWTPLEPTPGYDLLQPPPSAGQRVTAAARAAIAWTWHHRWGLSGGVLAAAMLLGTRRRRRWADALAVAAWHARRHRPWPQRALMAMRLIERRAAWAGWPRGTSQTRARWCGNLRPDAGPADDLRRLVWLSDWAAYAPQPDAFPAPAHDPAGICRLALQTWTLSRWRRLRRRHMHVGCTP
jgi:hypothetical protein